MNKEQQFPEDQQAAKSAMEHSMEKNVSIWHRNILKFCLIPRPHRPQTICRNHRLMNHLIRLQGKTQPNQ